MSTKNNTPKKMEKCITEFCDGVQDGSRGLCRSCYLIAYNLVRSKRTTWEELVSKGKCKTTDYGRKTSHFLS